MSASEVKLEEIGVVIGNSKLSLNNGKPFTTIEQI
jgi:hypothetical protein